MRSNKQHKNPRARDIETLEKRMLMAGDVSASIQGGDLIVRGDAEDNNVVITRPTTGTIRIAGRDETTINGEAFVELPQFTADLRLHMQQGGEDFVEVQGTFDIPDDLRARLGAGDLLVEGSFGPVTIGDELNVRTGEEGHVNLRNEVRVGDEASITAGGDVNVVAGLATVPDFDAAEFDDGLNVNNPYFPLVPGTIWTYESEGVDKDTDEEFSETIIVEVLSETRIVDGVEVRIVRDRVFEEGRIIEDTFDWYAQDNNGNLWYFGEDVTNYEYDEEGNPTTDHDGSWTAGVDGAQAGIIMEAKPRIGHAYYQEFAPGNVLDQGVGLATDESRTVEVNGSNSTFNNLFRSKESSVVEPFSLSNKLYAPGIGTLMEFDFDIEDDEIIQTTRLVSLTFNGQPVTQLVPTDFEGVNAEGRFVGGIEVDGEAEIHGEAAVVLRGAEFGDELYIRTPEEVIIVDSSLAAGAVVHTKDTLSLRNVFADEKVQVHGNPDDVYIFESDIHKFKGFFGSGDDGLIVRGSMIDTLQADGGSGKDTFEDLGGNDIGQLKLKRFVH